MFKTIMLAVLLTGSVSQAGSLPKRVTCYLGNGNYQLSCVPESLIETPRCEATLEKMFEPTATFLDEDGHEKSIDELCDAT